MHHRIIRRQGQSACVDRDGFLCLSLLHQCKAVVGERGGILRLSGDDLLKQRRRLPLASQSL